jgi:hypothetical protein
MPDAGAGSTSGPSLGPNRGGNGVCSPRGGRDEPVKCREAAAENDAVADEDVLSARIGRPVMAEVDRIADGRFCSFSASRFGVTSPASLPNGVALLDMLEDTPLEVDGRDDTCDDTCEADWERCRIDRSEAFLPRSCAALLLLARCPGVWLLGRGGRWSEDSSDSSGTSCRASVGEPLMIFWDRTTFVLSGDRAALSDDLPESAIVLSPAGHGLLRDLRILPPKDKARGGKRWGERKDVGRD